MLVLHDPVDGGDHLHHVGGTVRRADLHVDDAGAGSDAVHTGPGTVDDAGEVRAMAVGVEVLEPWHLGVEREVGTVDDLADARDRRDAGVDQCDVDT